MIKQTDKERLRDVERERQIDVVMKKDDGAKMLQKENEKQRH